MGSCGILGSRKGFEGRGRDGIDWGSGVGWLMVDRVVAEAEDHDRGRDHRDQEGMDLLDLAEMDHRYWGSTDHWCWVGIDRWVDREPRGIPVG